MALLLVLILPLGFARIWRLQHGIDSQLASVSQEPDDVLLRSGKLVKVMSLEYCAANGGHLLDARGAVLRQQACARASESRNAVAAAGCHDNPGSEFDRCLPVRRDVSQPSASGRRRKAGPGGRADPAGIQANPDYWRLNEDLGFVYYFDLKDYPKASEAFLEGARSRTRSYG